MQGSERVVITAEFSREMADEMEAASETGMVFNRSELIRRAVREYLDRRAVLDRARAGQRRQLQTT